MTKEQAEKIYEMHKELVSYALIEFGTTDRFASTEKMSRWRRKETAFKRYIESLIGDYMIIPVGKDCEDGCFGSSKKDS